MTTATKTKTQKKPLREVLDKYRGGISVAAVGAPGTGKSHFLGTIGEVYDADEVLLLSPKPREINSALYREYGFSESAEVFTDLKWRPGSGTFEADAFMRLQRRVEALYDDEEKSVVILDPYTDVVAAAVRDIAKKEKVISFTEMRDGRGSYGELKHKLSTFTTTLVGLASPAVKKPKHVLVAVHAQPARDDEAAESKGVEFEGNVLPMIEGGHRQNFAGEFDIVCYSKIKHELEKQGSKMQRVSRYVVQVGADPERHAKVAISSRLDVDEMENSLPGLLSKVLL